MSPSFPADVPDASFMASLLLASGANQHLYASPDW